MGGGPGADLFPDPPLPEPGFHPSLRASNADEAESHAAPGAIKPPGYGKGRWGENAGGPPGTSVPGGPPMYLGYCSVLRRRNVRDRPSSSNGVPYAVFASPWA
ncbi:hypothetical protein GCM10010207_28070 [Streptomyces atratus]|nr:hypothetical protein GCM10010207_28070 [Streptomyces atratus]